jgi:MOSC domain-containing protein YiiM
VELYSINIGKETPIAFAKKSGTTGIFKTPTPGPVQLSASGLPGDAIVDVEHHGGPDQAIYVYGLADYAWWSAELGRPLDPGTFGENLTITELESAAFRIGDYLEIGGAVLQITSPRIPCGTLAARLGDSKFVRRFRNAERPGLYCRVLQPGIIQAGDPVTTRPYAGPTVTVVESMREFYQPVLTEANLRRFLQAPLAIRDRVGKEAALQKILSQQA